jgi:hypothetical protein
MNITTASLMLIYPIGFLLTLTFYKYFGKKIGFDYDPPHEDCYDDWDSNSSAYLAFSIGWPIIVPLLLIAGFFKLMHRLTEWYLKL